MIRPANLSAAVLVAAALGVGARPAAAQLAPSTHQAGHVAASDRGAPSTAAADDPALAAPEAGPRTDRAPADTEVRPGVLAVATAAVPGLFYSGLGLRVAGDAAAGRRLARLHNSSLLALLAGGLPFAVTGASRRTSGYAMPLLLLGSGGFFTTWWADIYGAATGGRDARARTALPPLEAELGYAYVVDPRFDYRQFVAASAVARVERWALRGGALVAVDDPTRRFEVAGAYRWFGPAPGGPYALAERPGRAFDGSLDGSFVDIEVGAIAHRQTGDGFSVYTPTLAALGRLDLSRLGGALAGSFIDLSLGLGVELYDIDGAGSVTQVALQLARFGYGVYLGTPGSRYGEVVAYYDHRHDELAAGLGIGRQFDGPWGHLGLAGFLYLSERWGVSAEAEFGSAYVTRLSARFAWGRH